MDGYDLTEIRRKKITTEDTLLRLNPAKRYHYTVDKPLQQIICLDSLLNCAS